MSIGAERELYIHIKRDQGQCTTTMYNSWPFTHSAASCKCTPRSRRAFIFKGLAGSVSLHQCVRIDLRLSPLSCSGSQRCTCGAESAAEAGRRSPSHGGWHTELRQSPHTLNRPSEYPPQIPAEDETFGHRDRLGRDAWEGDRNPPVV